MNLYWTIHFWPCVATLRDPDCNFAVQHKKKTHSPGYFLMTFIGVIHIFICQWWIRKQYGRVTRGMMPIGVKSLVPHFSRIRLWKLTFRTSDILWPHDVKYLSRGSSSLHYSYQLGILNLHPVLCNFSVKHGGWLLGLVVCTWCYLGLNWNLQWLFYSAFPKTQNEI